MQTPFEIVAGRVYVDAAVNGGGPYTFAIDTGAEGMGRVDASLTRELGLKVSGAARTSDGVTTATVDTVHLDSVELAGLKASDLDLITRDYSSGAPPGAEISGILGRGFFEDGMLVIDFPNEVVWFTRSSGIEAGEDDALPYERPFRVPVSIGAIEATGHLDTGAGVTMVLPRTLYDQVEAGDLGSAGSGRLTNTTITSGRTTLAGPVRLGSVGITDLEVRVSDEYPELLVGGQVLQNYLVAIDQRSRQVAVCAP